MTTRIDSLSRFMTTEAFQPISVVRTNLQQRRRTENAIHSQLVPPLFHRFNPLRIQKDGTRRKKITKSTKSKAASTVPSSDESSLTNQGFDGSALSKYGIALFIQMNLIYFLFKGIDLVVVPNVRIPFVINAMFMYVFALKSRVFNPLSNSRPKPATKEIQGVPQRKMPTWTPPGFVFPIVWLLLIGPLRAVTSAMIIKANGEMYASAALMSLMLHLSIGDVWNSINNVERRYGTSVLGVICVWISAVFAAWQFSKVNLLAGKLLSLKLLWLTIASSLVTRTWQINPNPITGKVSPLLPTKGDGVTKFEWFRGTESGWRCSRPITRPNNQSTNNSSY